MEGRALKPMQLTGNVGENWRQWKQKFEIYSAAVELDAKSEKTQCAQLLFQMGEEVIDIFNTFTFMDEEKNKIAKLIKKFDNYFLPNKNITYERYKFFTARQSDKTIEEFVLVLKEQAQQCDFPDHTFKMELIKTMLIVGIKDEKIREHLLHQEYTLEKAVEVYNLTQCSAAHFSNNLDLPIRTSPNERDDENDNLESSAGKQCEKELNITKCESSEVNIELCNDYKKQIDILRNQITNMEVDKARPDATFRFTVPNLSKLKDKDTISPPCYVRNVPWKITVRRNLQKRALSVGVICTPEGFSGLWSCYASVELRLLPVRINTKMISRRMERLFEPKSNWIFDSFHIWDEVMDTTKGYVRNDTITLEMFIQANIPLH